METNRIPFLDLVTPHKELKDELAAVFAHALDTAGFIGGPMVEDFERNFAKYCDTQHCVGVGSGTDALALCSDGRRCKPWRRGGDCPQHLHRHNGSNYPGGRLPPTLWTSTSAPTTWTLNRLRKVPSGRMQS